MAVHFSLECKGAGPGMVNTLLDGHENLIVPLRGFADDNFVQN